MGNPRARTLSHMQHLLAAAAVGVSVSSCAKDEIRPEPSADAAPPPPTSAASAVGQSADVSADAGPVHANVAPVDAGGAPADAGTDAGKTTKKPPPPPPTGYRLVDPIPTPTRRGDKGSGF